MSSFCTNWFLYLGAEGCWWLLAGQAITQQSPPGDALDLVFFDSYTFGCSGLAFANFCKCTSGSGNCWRSWQSCLWWSILPPISWTGTPPYSGFASILMKRNQRRMFKTILMITNCQGRCLLLHQSVRRNGWYSRSSQVILQWTETGFSIRFIFFRYCKSRGALIVGITNTVSLCLWHKMANYQKFPGGFHNLPRVPLRDPHQRRSRDRSGFDEGVHQPDALPHHVRPRHVRGQDQPPAKEVGDHPGAQAAARHDQVNRTFMSNLTHP